MFTIEAAPLQTLAVYFTSPADVLADVREYGAGNINDTYLMTTAAGRRFILQRINQHVFKHPEWIMANIRVYNEHVVGAADGGDRRTTLGDAADRPRQGRARLRPRRGGRILARAHLHRGRADVSHNPGRAPRAGGRLRAGAFPKPHQRSGCRPAARHARRLSHHAALSGAPRYGGGARRFCPLTGSGVRFAFRGSATRRHPCAGRCQTAG